MQFIDLGAQRARISGKIEAAVSKVIADGRYILGPEVAEFEKRLADYVGVAHAIACANGTDALAISLWDKKESADAYNRDTYPEVLKSLVNVVEGTPAIGGYEVSNSTFHQIGARI